MSKSKLFLCFSFGLLLWSCGSQPTKPESSEIAPPVKIKVPDVGTQEVDLNGLQRSLGLERAVDDLGYQEKSFNTCEVGFGYSSDKDCKKQVLVVINYRLQCRDSEGTVSETVPESSIMPLSNRPIKWFLKNQSGQSETNPEGYGQIRTVASSSQKQERLKLLSGSEFLYLRAGTLNRVVTPKPWCD